MKQFLITLVIYAFNCIEAFAYKSGRGRLDSETSDLSAVVISLLGIIVGGFFTYMLVRNIIEKGFNSEDKEQNKWGCACFFLLVLGITVLVSMCSR